MSVHKKLMQARLELQAQKLNKSGENKFAGYKYFELGDFLPAVQLIFANLQLAGIVSFGKEEATLTITDTEGGGEVVIKSPMSEANLKGCHPVQNLGAVQTYIRRYLWVSAMEIVEHDALDATTGKGEKKAITPTAGALDNLPDDKRIAANDDAEYIIASWKAGDKEAALDAYETLKEGDQEYFIGVWAMLKQHSDVRNGLKKFAESKKVAA